MKLKNVVMITVTILVLAAVIFWITRRGEEETPVQVSGVTEKKITGAPDEVHAGQKEDASSADAPDEIEGIVSDDEEPDVTERTPEQQRRYEVLAQYLPRYFEVSKLIKEMEAQRPSPEDAPDELSSSERSSWYQQKVRSWNEKYGEQWQTLRSEKKVLRAGLEENFPEAAGTIDLGDGYSRFSLNLTKLRELVGGSLPTDKG